MKKVLLLLFVLVFTSCGGIQPRREVVDNIFYSNYPEVAILIDNAFVYEDVQTKNDFSFYVNSDVSGSTVKRENYTFLNRKRQAAIIITISTLSQGYWMSPAIEKVPHALERGYYDQNGYKYHYVIVAKKNDVKHCVLLKLYAKVCGSSGDTIQQISYVERIKPSLGGYDQWQDPEKLSWEQKALVSQFDFRSKKDIQFIKYEKPKK